VWKVENIIPQGGIGFVSAPPKDRKSLLTEDLALHLAQPAGSRLWLGKFACTPAKILYIAREDPARRIKERALEICQAGEAKIDRKPEGSPGQEPVPPKQTGKYLYFHG